MVITALLALPDDELDQQIYEVVHSEIYDGDGEDEIPTAYMAIYVASLLESEVDNGGFIQFFYNTKGALNELVFEALSELHADSYISGVRCAVEIYTREKALFTAARAADLCMKTLEQFGALYKNSALVGLSDLNKEFYRISTDRESLLKLRCRYIREHIDEFSSLLLI